MRSSNLLLALASSLHAAGCLASLPTRANRGLYTWWHDKFSVNENSPVAADEVRQSRKYNVSVSLAGQQKFRDSFVYETIPRNGNGKIYDPTNPGREYNLTDGDGITVEAGAGVNMAWTQFEYGQDVEVRVVSKDGSELGPASNVVIRPSDIKYLITSPNANTIVIHVPYDARGGRFSVEFQNDLYAYRSNGGSYVDEGGLLVSEEPKNALLIFASPFITRDLIPSKTSPGTQVLRPGKITDSTIGSRPTLYFEAGIYWVEKDGHLGKSHIKLNANTHYVYFEAGTYIKGAFEYTTPKNHFYTIGHGVVSGENYAYMANTAKNYVAEKDDRTSLRIFSHQSVTDNQKWHCLGPTLNAPPFNTVDLFPKNHTPHEEDNKIQVAISDYKQVGAFYFQTDGPQIYAGTIRDCFWHVNDDAIKLYHSNARVQRITVWKCHNDPVIQMGWKPRGVSGTSVEGLKVIHTRWFKSETVVPSSIIGASPNYADPKTVDSSRTMRVTISDVTCEGRCPALFRITPLQNYEMTVSNVKFDDLLKDNNVQLGQSLVGMKISDNEDSYMPGQERLSMGLHIKNWRIDGQKVNSTDWQANQLGQLNIHPDFWGDWSIE
ncbi:glycoside hydrolase [Thelonectria olida]|uniref:Glycoside hydrolase n=1 Tax=Thelonectria olida TaxID=1576542 RepID=A0A9P8VRA2_9HYPO|nr:glycoside hydrolase [Thelonectria olida]